MVSRCKLITDNLLARTHICVGTFNPVKVNTHASCEEAKSSVIATEAECLKAAKLLSVDESFTGRLVETTQLAYCGYYDSNSRSERVSYYSFEQSGISEHQGDYQCMQEGVSCVCNKGTHPCAATHHYPIPVVQGAGFFFFLIITITR